MDYSPQMIYWLGAKLGKGRQFEWTDLSEMSFQVKIVRQFDYNYTLWLPGFINNNKWKIIRIVFVIVEISGLASRPSGCRLNLPK